MTGMIRTVCPDCGTEQRVEVSFPKENAGFEDTTIKCEKCGVELLVTDNHEYDDNGLVKGLRDFCPVCKVDLGLCKTIWAAGTKLYCSRSCGKQDLASFDEYAEEINPQDISIVRR